MGSFITTTTGKVLKEVFSRASYWLLALAVTGGMLTATIILMNYSLLKFISASELFDTAAKLRILAASSGSFRTRISTAEQIVTLITALLTGVNVSVLAYYLKRRVPLQRAMGVSALGILGSFLGIGCASCGSLLLVSILGLTAAGGLLRALPLRGMEFGVMSAFILIASLFFVVHKLESPLVCKK